MTRQERVNKIQDNLQVARRFLEVYDAKFPQDFGYFSIGEEINLTFYISDEIRDQQLALIGTVFGRGNWEAVLEYYGKHFNWSKKVDVVNVTINNAQRVTTPEKFPVDPKQFPVQLMDIETI